MRLPGATSSGFSTPSISRRTARAVGRHDVVGPLRRARVFSAPTVSTDGVLPGAMMPPTTGRPSSGLAEIARRRDHQDARVHRALRRLAQRIVADTTRTPDGRATG